MEEMKNLIIQSLETRGVLGQIRAKIRSAVFKIVDEQEQKTNMGCGLKWENANLYKISETKSGILIAELMREFMECLKMDYSLSVFISESNISPEKLKKDEMFYKMGLKLNFMNYFGEIPIIYYIIYYFLQSLANNPDKVYASFTNVNNTNIEKMIEELIDNNLRTIFNSRENMTNDENMMGNNNEMNLNKNIDEMNKNLNEIVNKNNELNNQKDNFNFEKFSDSDLLIDNSRNKKSYEYDDIKTKNKLDTNNFGEMSKKSQNTQTKENKNEGIENNKNQKNTNILLDISDSSIIDEEIIVDESFERSNDKKTTSNNYNISQSGGLDGTVDSKSLEKYNYIEPVQSQK